jgi:murein L,D-transpeptidase YcbB/YkuD
MTFFGSLAAQRAPRRFWSLAAPVHAVVLVALAVGCARSEEPDSSKTDNLPRATSAITTAAPEVMPPSQAAHWVAELRSVHAKLDAAKSASEQRTALQAVERLFESTPPLGSGESAPELLPLRQDLASRAARVELHRGDTASAGRWAARGLHLAAAPSLFRANLLLDAAEVRRREGNEAGARAALLEAMQINQHLLEEELENP